MAPRTPARAPAADDVPGEARNFQSGGPPFEGMVVDYRQSGQRFIWRQGRSVPMGEIPGAAPHAKVVSPPPGDGPVRRRGRAQHSTAPCRRVRRGGLARVTDQVLGPVVDAFNRGNAETNPFRPQRPRDQGY